MAQQFAALKDAGIKYISLHSSYKVARNARESDMNDVITAAHVKCEIALEEPGVAYAAVRPAYFSSNVLWALDEIKKGGLGILYPDVKFDYLAPNNIGVVCGAVLTEPKFQTPDTKGERMKAIYSCGPELLSQRRAHEIMARKLGRRIKVREIGEEEWMGRFGNIPRLALEALLKGLRRSHEGHDVYQGIYEEAVENLRRHKEGEPMRFEEWVEVNNAAFT